MTQLTKAVMRNLREDKNEVLKALERNKSIRCTIQLQEEPGEILTTRCMKKEEIERDVNKGVHLLFPGCKATDITMIDDTLDFKIE